MLNKLLHPHTERAYAILRIVAGLMFAFHGFQKLFGVLLPPEYIPKVGTQMWFGGIIEFVAGLAIAAGFFTSWAAFLASGTMAVAYFQFHWKFQFDSNFIPIINKGEPAVLYCFLFLLIACKGGGVWSVDACRGSKPGGAANPE